MNQYFPELYDCSGRNVEAELDWSDYAIKIAQKTQQVMTHSNLLKRLM